MPHRLADVEPMLAIRFSRGREHSVPWPGPHRWATVAPGDMTDDELDELILGRLRNRWEHAARVEVSAATQSPADLATSFNEPESRVEERIQVLASEGRIKESTAAPGRWMIA
jgi:hypothetical protein